MTQEDPKPILVTGAHRTGTTWVGKMLTASGQAAYISEPLNVWHRPGVMRASVKHWYTYICNENETDYLPALRETLAFQYHTLAEIKSLRSIKDFLRMCRDWNIFLNGRLYQKRALIKDPFAVFSSPWFAERLKCQVVITIRHPAAFASSLKRLNWRFDFKDLLAQPLLMRDLLGHFREQMEKLSQSSDDILTQSSLLWRMIYQNLPVWRRSIPYIQIVRHEDVSIQPVEAYRSLYADLGLRFTERAEQTIIRSSASENPKELSKRRTHSVILDSQANLDNWKRRLEAEEIRRIRQLTEDIAAPYYSEQDWE